MAAFKELVRDDIDNIILNVEEFGELAMVENREMRVVFDDYKLEEMKLKSNANNNRFAGTLYEAKILMYCKPGDLGYEPAIDSFLHVNGGAYKVLAVSGRYIYRIILGEVI
jgi:hypothetical protein